MKISLKKYTEEDFADLVRCIEQLHDVIIEMDNLRRCRRMQAFGKNYTKRLIGKINRNHGLVLFACDPERIIGCIAGIIEKQSRENLLECVPTKAGRILELFVAEQHRNRGIGKRLMRKMEEYFKQNSCDVIRVDVFGPNKKASKFYRTLDYQNRAVDLIKLIR
jgi:ribosomal protein S18 acetylase RimI-like enzyme